MDQAIIDLKSTTFFGRRFSRKQIAQIQQTVKTFQRLSRRELAHTICEHYDWFTPNGSNRVHTCLATLEEIEKLGIITLPAKDESKKRGSPKKIIFTEVTNQQLAIDGSLDKLMPLSIQVVTEKDDAKLWNEFVDRHHYLGYKRPIGPHLRYFILDKHGRKLGGLLFSYATINIACRDEWIGWDVKAREKRLQLVINNNRFLIFPWVNVKCLASKALSMVTRQIATDWETLYGYRPVLLETFVDPDKYKGTCYIASNWQCLGKTQGRKSKKISDSRSKKDVYVYPLRHNFKSILINGKKPLGSAKAMKKRVELTSDDPFVQMWQKIIGIVGMVADDFDRQWQKRKRVLNTMLIILFIFRLVFSKNKQGYGTTIVELWDQCRAMNIQLPQPKPVAASAFCNARAKLDEKIFKTLNTEIVNTYGASEEEQWKWKGHSLYAVDGSKINLPRELLNSGYRIPSANTYYPQGLVSCLYKLKEKMPVDFDLVSHADERRSALLHLQSLNENDVVIYDRGYFSYVMLHAHVTTNIHAVFRLPKKSHTCIDEFVESDDIERVVVIESSQKSQKLIKPKYPEIQFIPLKLRLVKYIKNGVTYTLGTTLMDAEEYKIEELSDLYFSRWGVEELYKISKRLIEVEDFHARSERGVKQELFAHFILITLSRLFANQSEIELEEDKHASTSDKIKVNFKNCLITIARNLEQLFLQQALLVKNTINTIISSISTCRQKERPGRSYKRQSRKPIQKWRPSKNSSAVRSAIAQTA